MLTTLIPTVTIQSQRTALRRKKFQARMKTMKNTNGATGVEAVNTITANPPMARAT
jgi:hypothetical protein